MRSRMKFESRGARTFLSAARGECGCWQECPRSFGLRLYRAAAIASLRLLPHKSIRGFRLRISFGLGPSALGIL